MSFFSVDRHANAIIPRGRLLESPTDWPRMTRAERQAWRQEVAALAAGKAMAAELFVSSGGDTTGMLPTAQHTTAAASPG